MDLRRVDKVFRILPKEEPYYELFDVLTGAVVEGCRILCEGFNGSKSIETMVAELKAVENRGDKTTHEIMQRLQKSFVTPIDREDIHALTTALDDVLDAAYAAASFAEVTAAGPADDHLRALGGYLQACACELHAAIEHLNTRDGIREHCDAVHRLESEADDRYRTAMRALFTGSPDPLHVIRMKELYERIEEAVDRCQDIANILETIVIKNS